MNGQSKRASWTEAWANVSIGFVVSFFAQLYIFPMYGVYVDLATDLWIIFWFTVISLIRSYILRRVFNKATVKGTNEQAEG